MLLFGDLMTDGNRYRIHEMKAREAAGTREQTETSGCHLRYQDDYFTMNRNLKRRGVTRLFGAPREDDQEDSAELCAEIRKCGNAYVLQNVNTECSVKINGNCVPFGRYSRICAGDVITVCGTDFDVAAGLCRSNVEMSYQENPEVQRRLLEQTIEQGAVSYA